MDEGERVLPEHFWGGNWRFVSWFAARAGQCGRAAGRPREGRSCPIHGAQPGFGPGAHLPAAGALPGQEAPAGQVGLLGKAWPCPVPLELASLVTKAIDKLPKPQQAAGSLSAHCAEWETEAQSGAVICSWVLRKVEREADATQPRSLTGSAWHWTPQPRASGLGEGARAALRAPSLCGPG